MSSALLTADEVAGRRQQLLGLAEQIIFGRAEGIEMPDLSTGAERVRRAFTDDEFSVFRELGWNVSQVEAEVRRAKGVCRFRPVAGTCKSRSAAVTTAEHAEKELAVRGGSIHNEIAKLQGKLAELRSAADGARQVVTDQANAMMRLRKLAPSHVIERHQAALRELTAKRRDGKHVSDIEESAVDAILDCYIS